MESFLPMLGFLDKEMKNSIADAILGGLRLQLRVCSAVKARFLGVSSALGQFFQFSLRKKRGKELSDHFRRYAGFSGQAERTHRPGTAEAITGPEKKET
jgi:hypothetical protein